MKWCRDEEMKSETYELLFSFRDRLGITISWSVFLSKSTFVRDLQTVQVVADLRYVCFRGVLTKGKGSEREDLRLLLLDQMSRCQEHHADSSNQCLTTSITVWPRSWKILDHYWFNKFPSHWIKTMYNVTMYPVQESATRRQCCLDNSKRVQVTAISSA